MVKSQPWIRCQQLCGTLVFTIYEQATQITWHDCEISCFYISDKEDRLNGTEM